MGPKRFTPPAPRSQVVRCLGRLPRSSAGSKPTSAPAMADGNKGSRSKLRKLALGTYTLQAAVTTTYLESAAIRGRTQARYEGYMKNFHLFVSAHGLEYRTVPQVDEALTDYLNYLYWEGCDVSEGTATIAAFTWDNPDFGRRGPHTLPRVDRALRGWKIWRRATLGPLCRGRLWH